MPLAEWIHREFQCAPKGGVPILQARNDLIEIETAISQMPVGSYFPAYRFLIPLRFMDFLAN